MSANVFLFFSFLFGWLPMTSTPDGVIRNFSKQKCPNICSLLSLGPPPPDPVSLRLGFYLKNK